MFLAFPLSISCFFSIDKIEHAPGGLVWCFLRVTVMTSQGKDVNDNNGVIDAINHPVFFIQLSRPVLCQVALELFGFSCSCCRVFLKFPEDSLDLFSNGFVSALKPVLQVFISPAGDTYCISSHNCLVLLTSRTRPSAMSSSASFSASSSSGLEQ